MCLIFLSYRQNQAFPLVLAANRDEFYHRPSLPAHHWDDNSKILGGRDLEHGGTWLGVHQSGYFAAVTNVRNPSANKENAKSRGHITRNYLLHPEHPAAFGQQLTAEADQYSGFNLLFGGLNRPFYLSSTTFELQPIAPGTHGLSNASLNTPWLKVKQGSNAFADLTRGEPDIPAIFSLLADQTTAPDEQLPDTGIGLECERLLSSKFIVGEGYGTRASTVLMLSAQGKVTFIEQTFLEGGREGPLKHFNFAL